jgi:hypothetical protein
MLEIDNQIFLLSEQKNVLDESIAKLNKQSTEEQTHKNTNRKELLLEILADSETNLNLESAILFLMPAGFRLMICVPSL